ncbi:transcription termination factor 2, mitochondrial [Osmerus mordax]|uniref:transcription termination factor 2, mitochondrial n=1 Tax=Osmerus mordax TaxID=8014 RepID=UPI00350F3988
MLRVIVRSLCTRCQALPHPSLLSRPCSSSGPLENTETVDALYDLSVDIQKIRQLKGWVLQQSPAYVSQTAQLLRDLGAKGPVIARVLELFPEAVLCSPDEMLAQRELWSSLCPNPKDLVGIIEKFPASFFTSSCHHSNQRENIVFFRSLQLNRRVVAKLMASAPQSFSRPVQHNQVMVKTLQEAYLELGGEEANMKVWLQKLLSQNPFVLLKPPEVLRENLLFLSARGFSAAQLLRLLSKLRGFVTELNPHGMRLSLAYSQDKLACSDADLQDIVLRCPALLYFPEAVLEERIQGLLGAGVSLAQIIQTPSVLELTPQIVSYRFQRLRARGYNVGTGSLEVLNGTKKDFEASYSKLQLRRDRPLFNPVAPLAGDD